MLFAQVLMACDQEAVSGMERCDSNAMGIFLPYEEGSPASNIRLENFQYMSPGARLGEGVTHEELMKLHGRVKTASAKAFSSSKSSFEVMVRYTLNEVAPARLEMRTTGGNDENNRLQSFYEETSALTDFHSEKGTVYVVFHYVISPSAKD